MSRSYRKNPVIQDNKRHSKKWARGQANRRVRHYKLFLPDGATFKKLYQQWDICDYRHRMTVNDWLERWSEWYHTDGLIMLGGIPWYRSQNWYGTTIQNAMSKWRKQYYWK